MGRLLAGIALLAGLFGVAVWLMVRSNEDVLANGKPPSTTFAANGAPKSPLLPRPAGSEEIEPATPETVLPNLPARSRGQKLMELLNGSEPVPAPSAATIESYVQQHNRRAASLLTAWQASGNLDYLRQAATTFQIDPQVQFAVLASDALPDERAKWINLLKQSAPFNPLGNYYAAHENLRQGQIEPAMAELAAAAGKQIDEFTTTSFQDRQDLFTAAGTAPLESRICVFAVASPILQSSLEKMKTLGQEIAGARASLVSAGDADSAQKLAQAGIMLGQQMSAVGAGRMLDYQFAGMDIEQTILRQLPADDPVDWLGQTPANRLAELQQQRELMQNLSAATSTALPQSDENTFGQYVDQLIQSGELEAMKWLAARSPP